MFTFVLNEFDTMGNLEKKVPLPRFCSIVK